MRKRRYCAECRSIVPTFCWCSGQCVSVTAGESAGYELVAGGTHRSLCTSRPPVQSYNPSMPPAQETHTRKKDKSLLLGVWPLAFLPSPILLNAELAGGLAFVYPCLYSHSLGYTLMFSSVIGRTPLFPPRLEYSV